MLQKAKNLRKNQTEAEKLLWKHLRNRQLDGYKFRRQCPIGKYIVDFVCKGQRVIVEVDGGQHTERIIQDEERTRYLQDEGYSVIRFWNNEVLNETKEVSHRIWEKLEEE